MPISGLFTKKFERFSDYQGDKTKRNFSSRTDVFLKGPLFSKSTLKLARFDTKFVVVRKILLSALRQGLKFALKVLFVSCAFTVRFAEAPADLESTNEQDFRGCSCDDKPVFVVWKSTSKTQVFKTEEFSIDFIRRS